MKKKVTNPGQYVSKLLGGPTKAGKLLGVDPSTICAWVKRGHIPGHNWATILKLASKHQLPITTNHLIYGRPGKK